jgi:hypothetical protein
MGVKGRGMDLHSMRYSTSSFHGGYLTVAVPDSSFSFASFAYSNAIWPPKREVFSMRAISVRKARGQKVC